MYCAPCLTESSVRFAFFSRWKFLVIIITYSLVPFRSCTLLRALAPSRDIDAVLEFFRACLISWVFFLRVVFNGLRWKRSCGMSRFSASHHRTWQISGRQYSFYFRAFIGRDLTLSLSLFHCSLQTYGLDANSVLYLVRPSSKNYSFDSPPSLPI